VQGQATGYIVPLVSMNRSPVWVNEFLLVPLLRRLHSRCRHALPNQIVYVQSELAIKLGAL